MEVSQARVLLLSSVATLGLGVTSLDAQKVSGAQITGHVIDKSTGEHLPGMTIAIKGTTFGTATDNTGHFSLKHLIDGYLYGFNVCATRS